MMKPLSLGYRKIYMSSNFCMLYYLKNVELTECKTCEHSRYKPMTDRERTLVVHRKLRCFSFTPKLQRLFMSLKIVKHMIWHQSNDVMDEVMVRPFYGGAWKHFNNVHPQFSLKIRNVCLGLCSNGFNPFRSFVAPNSCWPVILTIYNLPSGMCMSPNFMFLSMVIPDPNSLSQNIDVCIQLLIDELKQLWSSRPLTYDISRK
jgi:hypothetical protein